ncbi:hypothetical protein L484_007068 [Morus notabilis]|uniref:Uncharacterized protein n=1 Tax=Morus notabilis TaxID=981085 RepID=W9RKA5_9ROSA|nr:hypothetical protein L484_007068 [Morus notabilis]
MKIRKWVSGAGAIREELGGQSPTRARCDSPAQEIEAPWPQEASSIGPVRELIWHCDAFPILWTPLEIQQTSAFTVDCCCCPEERDRV